eukprot:2499357-Pleurochrysis_carterae.AAC.1
MLLRNSAIGVSPPGIASAKCPRSLMAASAAAFSCSSTIFETSFVFFRIVTRDGLAGSRSESRGANVRQPEQAGPCRNGDGTIK